MTLIICLLEAYIAVIILLGGKPITPTGDHQLENGQTPKDSHGNENGHTVVDGVTKLDVSFYSAYPNEKLLFTDPFSFHLPCRHHNYNQPKKMVQNHHKN
jgi:hypothetical protein